MTAVTALLPTAPAAPAEGSAERSAGGGTFARQLERAAGPKPDARPQGPDESREPDEPRQADEAEERKRAEARSAPDTESGPEARRSAGDGSVPDPTALPPHAAPPEPRLPPPAGARRGTVDGIEAPADARTGKSPKETRSSAGDGAPSSLAAPETSPPGAAAATLSAASTALPADAGPAIALPQWAPAGAAGTHALSNAPPGQNAASAPIAAPPGTPGFATALGAQVTLFARNGISEARLDLNPAELGPISVSIQLQGNAAQVMFGAEHAATRQALEQSLPTLAGAMHEAGLTLAGGGVFDRPRQAPERDALAPAAAGVARADAGDATPLPAPRSAARGVLDLYA